MPDPLVWTIAADGAQPIVETYGFLTDIMGAWDGGEQRVRLRLIPLETLRFSVLAEDREARLAQSLIYAGHAQVIAVPLWQYGSRLTGSISIGASLLPIADAQEVPYRRSTDSGGYALVHRSAHDWELFEVASTSASGVTTSDVATKASASGSAVVYPARAARFWGDPEVAWLTPRVMAADLEFTGEQT